MLLELIITLGVKIIFTETPLIDCNHKDAFGCYYPVSKIIYLVYQGKDINYALYHEIGHALFLKDDYSRIIIKDYPNTIIYPKDIYSTEKKILDEKVADYFAEFMFNNSEFSVKHPVLYIYMRNKLSKLI